MNINTSPKVDAAGELRRLLGEKFPGAQVRYEEVNADAGEGARVKEAPAGEVVPMGRGDAAAGGGGEVGQSGTRFLRTGVAVLDGGGFGLGLGLEKGVITEVVGDPESACGAGLVVMAAVREASRAGRFVALVDGRDVFDPRSLRAEECGSLLWVRCGGEVSKALQATDLLLRDGNLPLVILDLQMCCGRELGRVPGSTWYRLRSLAELTGAPLLAMTPRPLISCARLRLGLPDGAFSLAAVELPRAELEEGLRVKVLRRKGAARVKVGAARMVG